MREATVAVADEEMLAAIQERQRDARYPMLLAIAPREDGVIYHRVREGTGLVTVAIRHDALTPDQHAALGEFRLHQYVLAGLYDKDIVSGGQLATDPAFDRLPDASIHILVGSPDGRILAYSCMQPPAPSGQAIDIEQMSAHPVQRDNAPMVQYLTDCDRPLLPTEIELIGPNVYSSLPALRRIPITQIWEWTSSIRNHVLQSRLSMGPLVEAIYTPLQILLSSIPHVQAMVSNINAEARHVLAFLGVPILYAPRVPTAPMRWEFFWAKQVDEPGRFWPAVAAVAELRAQADHWRHIDELLDRSASEFRRALIRELSRQPVTLPHAFVPEPGTSRVLWTADPFFGMSGTERSKVAVGYSWVTHG